jgi:hypothetical protein
MAMNKRVLVSTALFGVLALTIACAILWRNMSRKYIARWDMPSDRTAAKSVEKVRGNVCIVQHAHGPSEPSACADVHLFPHVYDAIGVDENRIIKWQNKNGFDSGGVDQTGALLAPGYPLFSRLAWTVVEPVYLEGNELSELLEESKRALVRSNDPVVRANLDKLSALAARAKQESKVLRIG